MFLKFCFLDTNTEMRNKTLEDSASMSREHRTPEDLILFIKPLLDDMSICHLPLVRPGKRSSQLKRKDKNYCGSVVDFDIYDLQRQSGRMHQRILQR